MSKATRGPQPRDNVVIADGEELDLRNRHLAAGLAWLIPGAGHAYQRRYLKSAIFSVGIFSTFLLGMLMSSGKCVYASWNETEKRWQFALQAGIGLPAMPAVYQAWKKRSGETAFWGTFMAAPRTQSDLDRWHAETASGFDMGTLYTMIAGLLNILVVFDAYAGPLPPPVPKNRRKQEGPDTEEESSKASPSAEDTKSKGKR